MTNEQEVPAPMKTQAPDTSPVQLSYLASQYPKISESFVIREILGLKAQGFAVNVASINQPDRGSQSLTQDEVDEAALTWFVKQQGVVGALKAVGITLMTHPLGFWRGLRQVFKLGRFDLEALFFNLMYFVEGMMVGVWMQKSGHQHLHVQLGSPAVTVGLYVKTVFNTGYSFTVHGPFEFYDTKGQYLAEKIIAADFIICISDFARSQLMNLSSARYWDKFNIVRLGVDPEVFIPKTFDPTPKCFELICVGRLTPAKGQHILVKTIALLANKGRKLQLRVVGDGEDRESLENLITQLGVENEVILEGAVNQERIRTLYAQADAFVIPSFAEGVPVVLMEAMAMEIPCVTTRITGIPELITDGESGLLVRPSNIEELAVAIERLMDDPALRERIGKNGRKRVMEAYHLPRNIKKLAEVFTRKLSAPDQSGAA